MIRTNKDFLLRFKRICVEINVSTDSLLLVCPSTTKSIVSEWKNGRINDLQVMQMVSNVAKTNPQILITGKTNERS